MTLQRYKIPDQIELKFDPTGTTLGRIYLQSIVGVKDGDQVVSQNYHRELLDPESPEATAALGAALQAALATVIPLQNQLQLTNDSLESTVAESRGQASQIQSLRAQLQDALRTIEGFRSSVDQAVASIEANPALPPPLGS